MNPFGYAFVGAGALLMRQVFVGRVAETPGDIKDLTVALLNADTSTMGEVLQRRGENVSASDLTAGSLADTPQGGQLPSAGAYGEFPREVVKIGNAAKGYVLGATGPNYFDCSGLVWRALRNLDIFTGQRFTTSTFKYVGMNFAYQVENFPGMPATPNKGYGFEDQCVEGDILLWETHHMGVYLRGTIMYSARSPSLGIGESDFINDSVGYFHKWPTIWRLGKKPS